MKQQMTDEVRAVLVAQARAAATHTYSPYSNFPVGAAVMMEDGKIYLGCNVENASYGLAMCAERVAVLGAVAQGQRKIKALAVSCPSVLDQKLELRISCGACRQVMSEFSCEETVVIFDDGKQGEVLRLDELLPRPFKLEG